MVDTANALAYLTVIIISVKFYSTGSKKNAMTLSIITFSITTLSIMTFIITINRTRHTE